ncbi:mucin-2-like [Anastrepha obliqua]|uniref:mucin-2-like n=1 Tax=Anastrepha obliqua TaxID=95512 RepID=UPI00240A3CE1|nr:mucin-2-like [Anastrepha obliqua]
MATTNTGATITSTTTTTTITTPGIDDDYVTVVEVDDPASKDTNPRQLVKQRQSSVEEDSSYITVLTINNQTQVHRNSSGYNKSEGNDSVVAEENMNSSDTNGLVIATEAEVESETELLVVHRQPGERLGFGLKFQGGTRSAEKVHKLYIQSCAADSPASRVSASWGALREGDEIVSIDGQRVCELTRIECVRCLKDNVAIRLQVRNGHGRKPEAEEEVLLLAGSTTVDVVNGGVTGMRVLSNDAGGTAVIMSNGQMKGSPPPPPPVPPRKLVKRKSLNGESKVAAANSAAGATPGITVTATSAPQSNEVDKPFTPPPDAEYYINLFADGQSLKTESESDDTASTISTVIDKFSMSSNYSSESDLSSYTSLTNGQNVINKSELAKVLKPFTMLEQEFNVNVNGNAAVQLEECLKKAVESTGDVMPDLLAGTMTATQVKKPATYIPGNNYENVEFKTEKVNTYENVELKPQSQGAPFVVLPTPKPRQVVGAASGSPLVEPKKRSIIPTPRKIATPTKLPIQVAPPTVPSEAIHAKTLTKTPTTPTASSAPTAPSTPNTPITPTNHPVTPANTPTTPSHEPTQSAKEFITKIPKAIASVFGPNSQRSFERARTEGEIKLSKQTPELSSSIRQQTAMFLDKECHSSTDSVVSVTRKPTTEKSKPADANKLSPPKSRIPVVLSPKRSFELEGSMERKLTGNSSNIPRFLTHKQKSETDLKLGFYRSKSKECSPPMSLKMPLQRTNSAETKLKSPERTLIPVFSGQSVSAEAILASTTPTKVKGPKPKPPERIQSLGKSPTHIPKLQTSTVGGSVTVAVTDRNATTHTTPPTSRSNTPTMQTFKQQSPTASASPNREIRFKIQTYESKTQEPRTPFTDVNDNEDDKMPSLFDLVRKHSPNAERKEETPAVTTTLSTFKSPTGQQQAQHLESNVDDEDTPPAVVGKCIKVSDSQPTYYSSSSDDDEDENSALRNETERDYDCEDGEKLGPPELINGPGPSEAYFNLYWHSNMLPTIGEVEEELSSLEPQSLPNGPIVIVDDLSQQPQPKQCTKNAEAEQITEHNREAESEEKIVLNALNETKEAVDVKIAKGTKPATEEVKESQETTKSVEQSEADDTKSETATKKVKGTKAEQIGITESTSPSAQIEKKTSLNSANLSVTTTHSPSTTSKARKSQFIGVPVMPPTVPTMEVTQTANAAQATSDDKVAVESATIAAKEIDNENMTVKENASEMNKTAVSQVKSSDKITNTATNVMSEVNSQPSDCRAAEELEVTERVDMPNAKANGALNGDKNEMAITANQVSINTAAPFEGHQVGQKPNPEELVEPTTINTKAEATKLVEAATVKTMQQTSKVETQDTHIVNKSENANAEITTTSNSSASSTNSEAHTEQTVQQKVEEKVEQKLSGETMQKLAHTKTTTTTKKQVIKSSTSSTQRFENTTFDTLDGLPEELRKALESGGKINTITTTKTNNNSSSSSTTTTTPNPTAPFNTNLMDNLSKPVAFTLQPYAERISSAGSPRITVFEERHFESNQNAYTEIRTRDATGEEKVQTSTESHNERAKLKKVHSHGDELDQLGVDVDAEGVAADNLEPMTVTATAETRISELAENPQDMQSIERGILNLSESGKQLQRNESGGVEYMECEHQVQDSYEDVEQILGGNDAAATVDSDKKPTLLRELSETLTLTKDGEKQVTRRSETTIETPKKGAKLLKKSDEERRLELEAQKLIESYQKVKKEAEKLFQYELSVEEGFDFGDDKQRKAEDDVTPMVIEVKDQAVGDKETEEKNVCVEENSVLENKNEPSTKQNKNTQLTPKETGELAREMFSLTEEKDVVGVTQNLVPEKVMQPSSSLNKLDATKLTMGFLEAERRFVEPEGKKLVGGVEKKIEEGPKPTLPTSISPDLLDNEPIYVLHKNIIEQPKPDLVDAELNDTLVPPVLSKVIEIEEIRKPIEAEVELPQRIRQFETVEIKIKQKLPASTNVNEAEAAGKITMQASKSTPPPIPQKREHKIAEGTSKKELTTASLTSAPTPTHTPTAKKRGSIELATASFGDHTTSANKLQTSKLGIPINTPKFQQNSAQNQQTTKSAQPAPVVDAQQQRQQQTLERIIVGVEQQQFDDANNKQTAIITFASEDLPTEMAPVSSPKQVVANVVSGGNSSGAIAAELHLETINLPNEPQNTSTPTEKLRKSERVGDGDGMQTTKTTPTTASTTFVSTSSSADSVQSVIEVGGIVESPSEDELGRGVQTDASEEGT